MKQITASVNETLCFVVKNGSILLGRKQRGLGAGKINGFGGHVEDGESIEQAAIREVREEACITVKNLQKRALLRFTQEDSAEQIYVHVFVTHEYEGAPQNTDEMHPHWYHLSNIPFSEMWPDDRHWLPLALLGVRELVGNFHFDSNWKLVKIAVQAERLSLEVLEPHGTLKPTAAQQEILSRLDSIKRYLALVRKVKKLPRWSIMPWHGYYAISFGQGGATSKGQGALTKEEAEMICERYNQIVDGLNVLLEVKDGK